MRRARAAIAAAVLASLASCVAPRPQAAGVSIAPPTPALAPAVAPRFAFTGAMRQGGLVLGIAPEGTATLRLDDRLVPLAPDRRFVIAFDRDAGTSATLVAELADGRRVSEVLAVAPGDWRIERIDASPTAGRSSAEFQRVRPAELARIAAARAVGSGAQGWRGGFAWPVSGRISGLFGAQRVYRGTPGSFHSGVDVAAPAGTALRAPADGVVVLATERPFTLEGNLLIVDHGMGLNSAFLHLSRIDVREGQPVRRGDSLGLVGATGRATGPHMHWGMKWRDARIDPMPLAGAMRGPVSHP